MRDVEHWPHLLIQVGAAPKAAFALLKTPYKNKAGPRCLERGTRLQTSGKNELLDELLNGK